MDEQMKQAEAMCERLRDGCPSYTENMSNGRPENVAYYGDKATATMSDAADTIAALVAEVRRLREALDLAANRLNRNAVDYIAAGNPRRYEAIEWANEARAALENRHGE